jgi:hypothetical protein
VRSLPFQGLWRGLGDPGFDPGLSRRPAAPASLAPAMVTSGPGSPNYACITDGYLHLSSRQAFHYVVVDSFLSDNPNDNHVSVRLKGGGGAARQRQLRAEFAAELFRGRRFSVNTTGDVLSAWVRGLDRAACAEELAMVGHLLRFLPRLDLAMTSEADVARSLEAFAQARQAARSPEHGAERV